MLTLAGIIYFLFIYREAKSDKSCVNLWDSGVWIFAICPGGAFLFGPLGVIVFAFRLIFV